MLQFLSFTNSSTQRTRFPQVERNSTQPSKTGESHIQNHPCCCKVLRSIAKQHIHKTGRAAINLDDVNLPSKLHIFANTNTNSTYFLSRSQYFNICSKAVTRWLKHHGLPPQFASAFMQKITAEWKLHLDARKSG